ncbi:hypothetical protein ACFL96_07870 [Thermoproteota archaeon]
MRGLAKIVLIAAIVASVSSCCTQKKVEHPSRLPEGCELTKEKVKDCPPGIYETDSGFIAVGCAEDCTGYNICKSLRVDKGYDIAEPDYSFSTEELAEGNAQCEALPFVGRDEAMRALPMMRWRDEQGNLCVAYEFLRE